MKVVGYKESLEISEADSLFDLELATPKASGKDILVKVEAVSVNPVDTKIRKGVSPENGQIKVLGWDAAGVVEAVGEDVSLFKVGDKVWYAGAIDRPGCNSEYHLVDERIAAKMPDSLNFDEAAALPLTTITAWEMLFDRLQLEQDSKGSLLIVGGAGGVGSIMIQLAKKLTHLTVIASASRPETIDWVKSMGADHVVNHKNSLVDELHRVGFDSVDHIATLTNTDQHLPAYVEVIAPQGKITLIDDPEAFDIMPFKKKSVSVHWEFMFTRSLFQTEDMIQQHHLLKTVAKLVDQGEIKTTMTENIGSITATHLKKAHALIESGKSIGKLVLAGF